MSIVPADRVLAEFAKSSSATGPMTVSMFGLTVVAALPPTFVTAPLGAGAAELCPGAAPSHATTSADNATTADKTPDLFAFMARASGEPRDRDPLGELTERELEVLSLIAEGRSNQAVGSALFLSPKTVESHIRQIFMKLGLEGGLDDHRRVLAVLAYLRRRG